MPQNLQDLKFQLPKISKNKVRTGFTHGDFHIFNAFIEDGKTVLMDFDNCGKDFFVADINSFIWANHYIGKTNQTIKNRSKRTDTAVRKTIC